MHSGAEQVFTTSVDGWTCGSPTAVLADPGRQAMLVIRMNGEPLPIEHGFPVRMVIPGLYATRVDEDFPAGAVYVPVVSFAQEDAILDAAFAIIEPVARVVGLTHSWWPIAGWERTSVVSGDERAANGWRDGSHGPSDVEGFGFPTQDNGDYLRVTRPPPRLGGAEMRAVVQGRDSEAGAQRVPVDGDGQVRWLPGGGGALFGRAGEPADLQQGIGVALRGGAGIGDAFAGGAGSGELLDQRPQRGTVLGLQEAFEPESPVAAAAQPEFPGGGCGIWLVTGFRSVGVKVVDDVAADGVQRGGVKRAGVAREVGFGGVAVGGADAGGNRGHRLGDHPHVRRADLPGGRRRGGAGQQRRQDCTTQRAPRTQLGGVGDSGAGLRG